MRTIRKVTLKDITGSPFTISLRKTREGYKVWGGKSPFKTVKPTKNRIKAEAEYRRIVWFYTHRMKFKKYRKRR